MEIEYLILKILYLQYNLILINYIDVNFSFFIIDAHGITPEINLIIKIKYILKLKFRKRVKSIILKITN